MGVHYDVPKVRVLIAARNSDRALGVARLHGLQPGQYAVLSYESHRAFPQLPMIVDASWSAHRSVDALEAIIAVRLRAAA